MVGVEGNHFVCIHKASIGQYKLEGWGDGDGSYFTGPEI